MKKYLNVLILFISLSVYAQEKKVLFIGNSYTAFNNLPQLVHDVAESAGDALVFQAHTPGSTTFMNHATSVAALGLINSDNWDYVALQGQSQEPAFPISQVETQTFPYAAALCDQIRDNDPCTRPLFYMTWGRENGDSQNCDNWPPVCTYEGMDSLLHLRYKIMADDNEAYLSPVGAVWRHIRENYPDIDLYAGDGAHPSPAGSYAAACTFYAVIFEKDPTLITFDYALSPSEALLIRMAAKTIAYDDVEEWNIDAFNPLANFDFSSVEMNVSFYNNSIYSDNFYWNFGDDNESFEANPIHDFPEYGSFTVTLEASSCGIIDTYESTINIFPVSVNNLDVNADNIECYPNPTNDILFIEHLPQINTVRVTDLIGHECFLAKNLRSNSINLQDLKTGLYFVIINAEAENVSLSKLILKL